MKFKKQNPIYDDLKIFFVDRKNTVRKGPEVLKLGMKILNYLTVLNTVE